MEITKSLKSKRFINSVLLILLLLSIRHLFLLIRSINHKWFTENAVRDIETFQTKLSIMQVPKDTHKDSHPSEIHLELVSAKKKATDYATKQEFIGPKEDGKDVDRNSKKWEPMITSECYSAFPDSGPCLLQRNPSTNFIQAQVSSSQYTFILRSLFTHHLN